jgi:prepilin-type N-terminal cleavage/methylation domain-containing protein
MTRRAFSLVEVMVVLLILAIVAGAVVLRFEGPVSQTRLRDVVDQVAAFDALSRARAQQQDLPVHVVVDAARGQMTWARGKATQDFRPAIQLPTGFAIGQVAVLGRPAESGVVDIPFSRLGLSPSYALRLDGPNGRQQWVLVAGLTGQLLEVSDEKEVGDIFAAAGWRLHAS